MYRTSAPVPKKGFTLIEVMVVISIIGILVSILVLSFDQARKHSRDSARKAALKQLQLAIETYKAQNGVYPPQGCGTVGTQWAGPGPISASWGASCSQYITGVTPDFIAVLPTDPNQENVDNVGMLYRTDATQQAYKLLSHADVETDYVTSFSDEFARCPSAVGACAASLQNNVYAVYSKGAESW